MYKSALITTTINIPNFLEDICFSIKKEKKTEKFIIIVIADKKTPIQAKNFCKNISKKYSIRIDYLDLNDQNKFFRKYSKIYKLFPVNDAVRKLLGSLYVWINFKKYIDRIIFIDDDNYLNKKNKFLSFHEVTNKVISSTAFRSKSFWLNIYKYLVVEKNIPIYPRGYPWKHRGKEEIHYSKKFFNKKVIVNCGYITGDPDIDAVSRLFWPIKVIKSKIKRYFFLQPGNFTPFNDQNTSISKDYIILYYKPVIAGRNSDIWTSYVICKMAEVYGEIVSYGEPSLKQIRNEHDYWKDYNFEVEHNIATDYFAELLKKVKIKKQKTKILTMLIICEKMIDLCNKESILKKRSKGNDKHYQGISGNEKDIRKVKCLKFIKSYFQEYKIWLKNITSYKLY